MSSRGAQTAIWVSIALIFTGLTVAVILTRSPWWDEGMLADPAHTLATAGYLGSKIMNGKGHRVVREFVAYDRYTFWTEPLYLAVLAGWIKLVGFSVVSIRLLSTLCGAGLIYAGALLTTRLTGSRLSGMLAALILATDYTLVLSAATARMDMMSAALGFGGLAAYAALRERKLWVASLVGGFMTAASCFTHPVGALHTGGLLLVAIFLDRKRLKWTDFAWAAVPYVFFAALWGIYIAQAPNIFLSQISQHAGYRMSGLTSPLSAILGDARYRYVDYFTPAGGGLQLKLVILLVYWAGILCAAFIPAIRRAPGVLLLLMLSGLYYAELALLDGMRYPHYMVNVIAMWALTLAAVAGVAVSNRLVPAALISAVLGGFVILQISGNVVKIWRNTYRNDYLPTIQFVMNHSNSQTLVVGPAELQFGLKGRRLVDDARLGETSGISPDIIVLDPFHPGPQLFEEHEPETARYLAATLTKRFALAATYGAYSIYLPVSQVPQ